MAEVSFLHFPENDQVFFGDHEFSFEEIPPTSHRHHYDVVFPSNPDPGPSTRPEDRRNQVSFVMDLFQQRVEQSHVNVVEDFNFECFGVAGGGDCSDLGFQLGLDYDNHVHNNDNDNDNDDDDDDDGGGGDGFDCYCNGLTEVIVSDCFDVDDNDNDNDNDNGNCNGNGKDNDCSCSRVVNGLMMVDLDDDDDDEDEEDFEVNDVEDEDLSNLLDSFQLQDAENNDNDSNAGGNHDFEWEEVVNNDNDDDDDDDDREVLTLMEPELDEVEEIGEVREMGNLEWEVLLNLDRNHEIIEYDNEIAQYYGDHDDMINNAEFELMFGHFAEGDTAFLNRPPASKAVVESLPSIVITKEDVVDENAVCAVCKDQNEVGEAVKVLPCKHRYHGDCVIPWLGIRNTCPVCRYELPTDDTKYEQMKARRAAHAHVV